MDKKIDGEDLGNIQNGENQNKTNPEDVKTPQDKNESKPKSIWQTAREINAKERREQVHKEYANAHKVMENQSLERDEYAKGIYDDKLNLLKKKQGMINEEEDVIEEEKHYTFGQKLASFFYLNKWWLGITACIVFIAGFLIYDWATTERADVKILMLSDNYALYSQSKNIEDYFEQFIDDYNHDGKVIAEVFYIPTGGDSVTDYQEKVSIDTKRTAEFESGESLIVIADSRCDDYIEPEVNLTNLERYISGNKNIDKYRCFLKDTDFADKVSFNGDIPDDLYIGIRKVQSDKSYEKDMNENYENIFPALKSIIDDIS